MTRHYHFRLTEEIARWAFEVHISSNPDWFIAFTNPTAGPWKRLMGRSDQLVLGEVHRFERTEARPDLVIVCDRLQTILIIEAKDSMQKLTNIRQVDKSVDVVKQLTKKLRNKHENLFWQDRHAYTIVPAILWGSEEIEASPNDINKALKLHESVFDSKNDNLSSTWLGISAHKANGEIGIACSFFMSHEGDIGNGVTTTQLISALSIAVNSRV